MKRLLIKLSTWKLIVPFFILLLVFPAFLFPYYQGRMAEVAGEQIIPLDSRFSYTYDEVKNDFDKLGSEGREIYRFVIAKVDNFFALFYGPFFILVLAWLLKKITREDSGWIFLSLFPLIGILFEYLENINTMSLLDSYPAITQEAVSWGSQMTALKQIFLMTSVALMPLLALTLAIKTLKRGQTSPVISKR